MKCVTVGAPLSAVVMMGGMLEGLRLARVNQLKDKSPVFKAANAPKDKAGNPLKLNEWGLKNYLDVAHEFAWISKTTRDVGEVVQKCGRQWREHSSVSTGGWAWEALIPGGEHTSGSRDSSGRP